MPDVRLDLRGLAPGQGPSKRHVAAAIGDAETMVVCGPVPALAAVLAHLLRAGRTATVTVSWEPAGDGDATGLARDLGLGTGAVRDCPLVRDDHGGVLLHHGRIEAAPAEPAAGSAAARTPGAGVSPRLFGGVSPRFFGLKRGLPALGRRLGTAALGTRLGAQAHHDAVRVADGEITRIDVRPDWQVPDTIGVAVVTLPLRPVRRSTGRALQVACDPARVLRDGVPYERPVRRWTWYADDRVRWRLQP